MSLASRKILILSTIAIFLLLMVAFMYGPLSKLQGDSFYSRHVSIKSGEKDCGGLKGNMTEQLWQKMDVRKLRIPKKIKDQVMNMEVISERVSMSNISIHYRTVYQVSPKKMDVLLLHGYSFDSKAWEKLYTIQFCTAFGYRTIAVDLPGYGLSAKASVSFTDNFIHNFIKTMNLVKPVLISPSVSGLYSIPYIITNWTDISGYVPVAPVSTSTFEKSTCPPKEKKKFKNKDPKCSSWMKNNIEKGSVSDLSCIKVPTMVVCGEADDKISSARLCHLPFSKGAEIPHAPHAAYLTDPELWNEFLYNFLSFLNGC